MHYAGFYHWNSFILRFSAYPALQLSINLTLHGYPVDNSNHSYEYPGTAMDAIAGPLLCICCDSRVSQEYPRTTVTVSPPAVAICHLVLPLVHASIRGFLCVPERSWDYCVATCKSNMPSYPSIQGFLCITGTP